MVPTVADLIAVAKRERFVGRAAECASFESIVANVSSGTHVLFVHGPPGMGKSTLLDQFLLSCGDRGIRSCLVDGRVVGPSSDSFLIALAQALDLSLTVDPFAFLGTVEQRLVMLIDNYESMLPLDAWLRERLVPRLSQSVLVVIASRTPPSAAWRADPGLHEMVHSMSLRNFTPDESKSLLRMRRVPMDQCDPILRFTHGHPLALSLVADVIRQRPDSGFRAESSPDLVSTILKEFVDEVPDQTHRKAMEISALVHFTNESLLARALELPDVHSLFEWLRSLSFFETSPLGILPHDLAREALAADLRWRNPDWYREIHARVRRYYSEKLKQTRGAEQGNVLFEYIYLHRHNPVVSPFFDWQESLGVIADPVGIGDRQGLLEMIERHEGEESAEIANRWLMSGHLRGVIYRDSSQEAIGLLLWLDLPTLPAELRRADPAAESCWRAILSRSPARPGERVTLFRFWVAKDAYQSVSPIQSLAFVGAVQHYLTTSALAYTFFPCADPDFWAPIFAYADLERREDAGFSVGGRRYGVYGHDWRLRPPMGWLELLAEREVASGMVHAEPSANETLLVLSQPEFVIAVRQALRDLNRPTCLNQSPLLRSSLVVGQTGPGVPVADRVIALRGLLTGAIESLAANPRDRKLYRALDRTFIRPAPTQELAAEALGLPFSTYRRHLTSGIERVTSILWDKEVQSDGPAELSAVGQDSRYSAFSRQS